MSLSFNFFIWILFCLPFQYFLILALIRTTHSWLFDYDAMLSKLSNSIKTNWYYVGRNRELEILVILWDLLYFLYLPTGHVIVEVFTNSSAEGDAAANGAEPGKTCRQCHERFKSVTKGCRKWRCRCVFCMLHCDVFTGYIVLPSL